ncbi:MAG: phosphodiester glycosidase family protein [Candidatus Margulisbacteria bacterium]|nr:phosphodiester glycosidase family protein [Candidatus Margulisiibacteriota bacterium]
MQRLYVLLIFALIFVNHCFASTLYHVRCGYYPENIRIVFDFDENFSYATEEAGEKIIIRLKNTAASSQIPSYVDLNDLVVRYLQIEKEDEDLLVTIPLSEDVNYKIFSLSMPPRLVIDFDRDFLHMVSGGMVGDGVEYLKIKQGSAKGNLMATVVKIDPNKARVEPVLAKKFKPGFLESFISFLAFWNKPASTSKHFYIDKVKNMADDSDALAGINGTFFANSGSPLGALIINEELVSLPVFDRTALIIDDQNKPHIDTVYIKGVVRFEDGKIIKISGINQKHDAEDVIVYTPVWGERTGIAAKGLELVIDDSQIKQINPANSKIPPTGYVISLSGNEANLAAQSAKAGSVIETQFKIIPYHTSPSKVVHLISGGPRLLKNGRIYVSKHEEKFRADVAEKRAARTAVGITRNNELILIAVAAPQKNRSNPSLSSLGASLEELARLLQSLGAVNAFNLDGGGSTTMIVDGRTVCGGGRRVSNALLVLPKN